MVVPITLFIFFAFFCSGLASLQKKDLPRKRLCIKLTPSEKSQKLSLNKIALDKKSID